MAATFEALTGAAGDVKELEYISALHQTREEVRRDASIRGELLLRQRILGNLDRRTSYVFTIIFVVIQAEDVRLFLVSRYGIVVTDGQVRNVIFAGLAGSNEDDESLE